MAVATVTAAPVEGGGCRRLARVGSDALLGCHDVKPLLALAVLTVLIGIAVWIPTTRGGARESVPRPSAVEQRVTRAYGAQPVGDSRTAEVPSDATVLSLLRSAFQVETGAGDEVESIEGHAAGPREGRPRDWSYFVNGIRAAAPADETGVSAGDRIWWDLNGDAGGVEPPAVVGSFPEPFLSGSEGRRRPVRIDCSETSEDLCDEVTERLSQAGVSAVARSALNGPAGDELLRIVVGPWSEIRRDPTVRQLERAPSDSEVFAQFRDEGRRLMIYDSSGRAARTLGAGSGLAAALRFEGQQPAWVVTGTDAAGAAAAAGALREEVLRERFAVAVEDGMPLRVPLAARGDTD